MAYKLSVVLEGRTFPINLRNCGGCEWCTLGAAGWFCDWDEDPTACEYPEDVLKKNPAQQQQQQQQDDGQMTMFKGV